MIQPTEYDDLRMYGLSERESLAAAAILPNLPPTNALVTLRKDQRTNRPAWEEPETIARLRRNETPIVPGGDVYRVVQPETDASTHVVVAPVPHGRREYYIHENDVRFFVPPDPADTAFETDQTTLTDFGIPTPHFAHPADDMSSPYDRKSHLPV